MKDIIAMTTDIGPRDTNIFYYESPIKYKGSYDTPSGRKRFADLLGEVVEGINALYPTDARAVEIIEDLAKAYREDVIASLSTSEDPEARGLASKLTSIANTTNPTITAMPEGTMRIRPDDDGFGLSTEQTTFCHVSMMLDDTILSWAFGGQLPPDLVADVMDNLRGSAVWGDHMRGGGDNLFDFFWDGAPPTVYFIDRIERQVLGEQHGLVYDDEAEDLARSGYERVVFPDDIMHDWLPDIEAEIGDDAHNGIVTASLQGVKSIRIADGVRLIGQDAFANLPDLERVFLPDSIEGLDNNSFLDCPNLKFVRMPAHDVELKNNTFAGTPVAEVFRNPEMDVNDWWIWHGDPDLSHVTDIYYRIDGGTAYLRSHPAKDYEKFYWQWTGNPNITKVVIEDEIAPSTCNHLFSLMPNLTEIEGLENIDTSNVTDMCGMFECCSSLTSLDLSSFDTSNVTDMYAMFYDCTSLKSLDVSSFDTNNVTDMSDMFYDCKSLASLDLSNLDTSKAWNVSQLFHGCDLLETVTTNDEGIIDMIPNGVKVVDPTARADKDATPSLGDTLDQFSATMETLQAAVTALQGNIADMRETIGHDPR